MAPRKLVPCLESLDDHPPRVWLSCSNARLTHGAREARFSTRPIGRCPPSTCKHTNTSPNQKLLDTVNSSSSGNNCWNPIWERSCLTLVGIRTSIVSTTRRRTWRVEYAHPRTYKKRKGS